MNRLRSFMRARWHLVLAVAALGAIPVTVWVAVNERSVGLVALLALQAVAMVGLAIVGARVLVIYRRIGRLESRVDKVVTAVRKPPAAPPPAPPPAVNLTPVLNGIGAERLDAAFRHSELLELHQALSKQGMELERRQAELAIELAGARQELGAETAELHRVIGDLKGNLATQFTEAIGENAALHNIYRLVDVEREVPSPVGFATSPQTLLRLVDLSLSLPDNRLIVECGSGASTVWLAHACRRAGSGRVVALEHDDKYGRLTREAISRNGLEAWAEVRSAPLESIEVDGQTFSWYSRSAWSDLNDVQLLFVDGPPGFVGPRSRYPAFPLLAESLAEGAIVALDDAHRDDERQAGRSWLSAGAGGVRLDEQGMVGRTWLFRATRGGS